MKCINCGETKKRHFDSFKEPIGACRKWQTTPECKNLLEWKLLNGVKPFFICENKSGHNGKHSGTVDALINDKIERNNIYWD